MPAAKRLDVVQLDSDAERKLGESTAFSKWS